MFDEGWCKMPECQWQFWTQTKPCKVFRDLKEKRSSSKSPWGNKLLNSGDILEAEHPPLLKA